MQQLTINIPDSKMSFFIDLVNNLGFTVEGNTQKINLSEKQVALVNDARRQIKENPASFQDWDEVKKHLRLSSFKGYFHDQENKNLLACTKRY